MKVCIWPDYQRISFRDPRSGQLSGLDIDLATALASDLQTTLRIRRFIVRYPGARSAHQPLRRGDVRYYHAAAAWSSSSSRRPYLQSDVYAVTTRTSRIVRQWRDIDQPGVLVGVQAGAAGHMIRQRRSTPGLLSIGLPQTRGRRLMAGLTWTFMTDYPYGRALIENGMEPGAENLYHTFPCAALRPCK